MYQDPNAVETLYRSLERSVSSIERTYINRRTEASDISGNGDYVFDQYYRYWDRDDLMRADGVRPLQIKAMAIMVLRSREPGEEGRRYDALLMRIKPNNMSLNDFKNNIIDAFRYRQAEIEAAERSPIYGAADTRYIVEPEAGDLARMSAPAIDQQQLLRNLDGRQLDGISREIILAENTRDVEVPNLERALEAVRGNTRAA